MNDIEVQLHWQTGFNTPEEVEKFKRLIGEVHNQMYGANVAGDKLVEAGFYQGAKNYIEVEVRDNRNGPEFAEGDHVGIKIYKGDEYNYEARVNIVNPNKDKPYHVSNMNMPFMGTVSGWFRADQLEKL